MSSPALYVAFVANGAIHDHQLIGTVIRQNYHKVVAIDGGLSHCEKMGIRPDLIIGDMDSVSPVLLQRFKNIPLKCYPVDKDETDLELAISEFLTRDVNKVTIFGALEKRTDHSLYNLYLMSRYPGKLWMQTEREQIFAIDKTSTIPCKIGQTVSLIPLGEAAIGVTTHGLKWELKNATIDKSFMSISNICIQEPVTISIDKGTLICCLS